MLTNGQLLKAHHHNKTFQFQEFAKCEAYKNMKYTKQMRYKNTQKNVYIEVYTKKENMNCFELFRCM
jgi:hypothetical protein